MTVVSAFVCGHDQGRQVEADVFLPVFRDTAEGIFEVRRIEHRADGSEQGDKPFADPFGAGFRRHGETVLSC